MLWIAFVLVHVAVARLGFVLPSEPMGDVYKVYEPWSQAALHGGEIVGVTTTWVYPQWALLPMVVTQPLGALLGNYTVGWALLVTLTDAAAFAILVGNARSGGRSLAAWFWLAAILALGPAGVYRLEGLTAPLVIVASLWLVGRPWLAAIVLAVATWIKIWPAAVLAAALVVVRRRFALVGGAVAVSVITVVAVVAFGGFAYAFGFITDQTTRGLQIEAPVSMPYMWGAVVGLPGFDIEYSRDLLTFQVTGPHVDTVVAAMTPALVLVVAAIWVLGAVKGARGIRFASLFPPLALALVTALIVFNKVGSPQYVSWLVPAVVVGLVLDRHAWRRPALLVLGISALTQWMYPILYAGVLTAQPGPVAVLTVRNVLLVVLFGWMVVRLTRLRAHARLQATVSNKLP